MFESGVVKHFSRSSPEFNIRIFILKGYVCIQMQKSTKKRHTQLEKQ